MKMGAMYEHHGAPKWTKPSRVGFPIIVCFLLSFAVYTQFGFLYSHLSSPTSQLKLAQHYTQRLEAGLQRCEKFNTQPVVYPDSTTSRTDNPRWNNVTGQHETVILHNVTLFDGDSWIEKPVDISFEKGVITKISHSTTGMRALGNARIVDMQGRYITPGLVDMHSHHLVGNWPELDATEDTNEVNKAFGPLTPFVRSLDGIKPYDEATNIIRSGGVTSSLILPGSANIMGGEAYVVKNVLRSGKNSEENVDELLLEYGVSDGDRRRYMKMACGENPKDVYKHTRMGNAWIFRKHMERALELKTKQDAWCLAAAATQESGNSRAIASLVSEGLIEEFEFDSSIGMLRGHVGLHNHCYEPEDFETMLRHSAEFGFKIHAFHHALSAWKVPEMIKASGQNITIATFSDFGFYKQEGYEANLYAGKILEEHGVPVAYKSDHFETATNAKYLLFEAQNAHAFGMSEKKALQSVTSVPARSLRLDHRIGYVKVGYDADLVVWDSHPLSIGATPLQVYVDGRETLDEKVASDSLKVPFDTARASTKQARSRPFHDDTNKKGSCAKIGGSSSILITGIRGSYLPDLDIQSSSTSNLTMVIEAGTIRCLDTPDKCVTTNKNIPTIHLQNGHVLPGLIAVTTGLGLEEIAAEKSTQDGRVPKDLDISDQGNLIFARYGVHLEGKAFKRAQIGGVTRAVTIPHVDQGGFGGAVSAGIKTSEKNLTLDGGIFQDEVGLHFVVGQDAKATTGTVSASISKLRSWITKVKADFPLYSAVTNGSFPLIVHTDNKYDILQLIRLKQTHPNLNLIIYDGAEAPLVATELAASGIPLIFTHHRGAPDVFEKRNILTGPPLTRSPVSVLHEANVTFALAIKGFEGNSFIHNLAIEASWAAKYAGLRGREAVELVSGRVEGILGLKGKTDVVVWEGDPLEFGASPAVVWDGDEGLVVGCWPVAT